MKEWLSKSVIMKVFQLSIRLINVEFAKFKVSKQIFSLKSPSRVKKKSFVGGGVKFHWILFGFYFSTSYLSIWFYRFYPPNIKGINKKSKNVGVTIHFFTCRCPFSRFDGEYNNNLQERKSILLNIFTLE